VQGLEERLEALKGLAGERLTDSQNSHASFLVAFKRMTANLAAAKEAVALFETELIPASERGLVEARARLQAGFLDFAAAQRPTCEAKMADLVGAVLAERDTFMAALDGLAADFGATFSGNARTYPDGVCYRPDTGPYCGAGRVILTALEEQVTSGDDPRCRRAYPTLTPPAPEPPPAAPQAPETPQDGRGPSAEAPGPSADLGAPGTPVNVPPASGAVDVAGAEDVDLDGGAEFPAEVEVETEIGTETPPAAET
jgi:hypothetical protein